MPKASERKKDCAHSVRLTAPLIDTFALEMSLKTTGRDSNRMYSLFSGDTEVGGTSFELFGFFFDGVSISSELEGCVAEKFRNQPDDFSTWFAAASARDRAEMA